jgi:hypothetical protein
MIRGTNFKQASGALSTAKFNRFNCRPANAAGAAENIAQARLVAVLCP